MPRQGFGVVRAVDRTGHPAPARRCRSQGEADGALLGIEVDRANGGIALPRNGNKHGQVLELTENDNDPAAEGFGWRLFLVCGDPADPSTYFRRVPKDQVSPISCPDNLAFDATPSRTVPAGSCSTRPVATSGK
jgi:hypothetical protein